MALLSLGDSSPGAAADIDPDLLRDTQAYLRCLLAHQPADQSLHDAWEQFYLTYNSLLGSFAQTCRVPPEDLHDVLQDVWKQLLTALPRLRYDSRRGRFRSWLFAVVHSKAANLRRRRARHHAQSLGRQEAALAGRDDDPATSCERRDRQEVVQQVLAALRQQVSPRGYRLVYLRWIEGRAMSEIATALDLTPRQVWFLHHRMKLKLRALFASGDHTAAVPQNGRKSGDAMSSQSVAGATAGVTGRPGAGGDSAYSG